jgi:hypothetical protein
MTDTKEAPKTAKATKTKKPDTADKAPVVHAHHERVKSKSSWTLAKCQKFARRFSNESEWSAGHPASYKSAQAHNWVSQCVSVGQKNHRKAG